MKKWQDGILEAFSVRVGSCGSW